MALKLIWDADESVYALVRVIRELQIQDFLTRMQYKYSLQSFYSDILDAFTVQMEDTSKGTIGVVFVMN